MKKKMSARQLVKALPVSRRKKGARSVAKLLKKQDCKERRERKPPRSVKVCSRCGRQGLISTTTLTCLECHLDDLERRTP